MGIFAPHHAKICELLKSVKRYSDYKWCELKEQNEKQYRNAIEIHELLTDIIPPLSYEYIEILANENLGVRPLSINNTNQYYYLPPIKGDNSDFIPFLNLTCDLSGEKDVFCLRIGMLKIIDLGTDDPKPLGFGYRFEIGHDDTETHNYCHVQFSLEPSGIKLPNCPTWAPQQTPCIPTPATNPVSVFLTMLISFYGKEDWSTIISDVDIREENMRLIRAVF